MLHILNSFQYNSCELALQICLFIFLDYLGDYLALEDMFNYNFSL